MNKPQFRVVNKINKINQRLKKIERNFDDKFKIDVTLEVAGNTAINADLCVDGDVKVNGTTTLNDDLFLDGSFNLLGFGTQVDVGRLDEFIPIGSNPGDDPLANNFADEFIDLLTKFGYTITAPSYNDNDIRVSRRYTRVGNNINVDGSLRIRIAPESALYVTIVVLRQIGLMPLFEAISAIINSLLDASIVDIPSFINTLTNDIVPKIIQIGSEGVNNVPFKLGTIKEKDLAEQYIISDQTYIDDNDTNKTVEIAGGLPQIGGGLFYKLKTDILVNELDDLIAVTPGSVPDSFTIPTSDLEAPVQNAIDGLSSVTETQVNNAISTLNGILSAIESFIDNTIVAAINDIINAVNTVLPDELDLDTISGINIGSVPSITIPPVTIVIPDIEIPLASLVSGIVEAIDSLLGATIKLLTITADIKDLSYDIFGEPGTKEVCLNFFQPISSQLISKLYDMIKELISVVNTATGDFKIPMELLRAFITIIVLIVEVYVVGETRFSYSYRCNLNQIPTQ